MTARRLVPRLAALVVGVGLVVTSGFVRALSSEAALLVEALGLREGMIVADVGAGDGNWLEPLAEGVGDTGHVYATEINPDDVAEMEERARREDRETVTAILGTATETGLPDACCDAILLRMVYHHFTDPAPMRASLRRALRPGGRLVVVDLRPRSDWGDLPGVPDRGGHGIREAELVAEMTADGFEVVARHDEWAGHRNRYCVVFRRAGRAHAETTEEER